MSFLIDNFSVLLMCIFLYNILCEIKTLILIDNFSVLLMCIFLYNILCEIKNVDLDKLFNSI